MSVELSYCRSCGKAIWWRVNPSGKRQPMDVAADGKPSDMPHHATCPSAAEWRKKPTPGRANA